jgi:RHS repeat-associated protein
LQADGATYFFVKNLQGDVTKVVDDNGTIVAEYAYDAWGAVISSSGSMSEINPIRYRGYYFDVETGLYYCQQRYYNPMWGRWVSADSLFDGRHILGNNLYAYCGNDPVNYVDFTGNASEPFPSPNYWDKNYQNGKFSDPIYGYAEQYIMGYILGIKGYSLNPNTGYGDGKINSLDAMRIRRIALGLQELNDDDKAILAQIPNYLPYGGVVGNVLFLTYQQALEYYRKLSDMMHGVYEKSDDTVWAIIGTMLDWASYIPGAGDYIQIASSIFSYLSGVSDAFGNLDREMKNSILRQMGAFLDNRQGLVLYDAIEFMWITAPRYVWGVMTFEPRFISENVPRILGWWDYPFIGNYPKTGVYPFLHKFLN